MAENESPTTGSRIIGKRSFMGIVAEHRTDQGKVEKIAGDMGKRIATAAEKQNLNKKAFGLVMQCLRMDQAKLNTFLTHFDVYRAHADLDKLAGEALIEEDRQPSNKKKPSGKDAAAGEKPDDDEDDEKADPEPEPSPFRQVAGGANTSRLG